MNRILIIEDDLFLGEVLKDYFEASGLAVAWAQDGNSGLQLFESYQPQLILADVILPDKNGFEVVTEIRKTNNVIPIIFMTGTQFEASDQIKGYKLGAVNYIRKPIIPQAVLVQINNLLNHTAQRFTFENFNILINHQSIVINDTEIVLRDKEEKLLLLLLKNNQKVISRNDILLSIWNDNSHHLNNILDSTVSQLKKKLIAFPTLRIKSVYGIGYKVIVGKKIKT
jgi:DNA-binding response OmpR family regulator